MAERLISREGPAPAIHSSASLSMTYHLTARGFGVGTIPDSLVAMLDPARKAIHRLKVSAELELPDLEFVVAYMPERNRRIGQLVARAARD